MGKQQRYVPWKSICEKSILLSLWTFREAAQWNTAMSLLLQKAFMRMFMEALEEGGAAKEEIKQAAAFAESAEQCDKNLP